MRALAWTLFGAVAVLAPVCAALGIAGDRHGLVLPEGRESMLLQALVIAFASLEFAVVGLLIARRQQRNPIGWIFLAAGALLALVGCAYGYADLVLYGGFDWPLVSVATWLTAWAFIPPVFVAPCLIALLFPTGAPLTPRWRYAVWFVAAGLDHRAVRQRVRGRAARGLPRRREPRGLPSSRGHCLDRRLRRPGDARTGDAPARARLDRRAFPSLPGCRAVAAEVGRLRRVGDGRRVLLRLRRRGHGSSATSAS